MRGCKQLRIHLPCPLVPLQSITVVASPTYRLRAMRGAWTQEAQLVYPEAGEECRGMWDTFLGVRFLSATTIQTVVMSAYLPDISRSQSFSLSQRLSRLHLVVLFHTTTAHRILSLQSFLLSGSRSTLQCPILSCC